MRRLAACVWGLVLVGGCASPPVGEQMPPAIEPEVRAAPPDDNLDHLGRAAACVERGDEPAAIPHLEAHLAARPHAVMIRAYLAELLLRTGRPVEARDHYEQFTRQACGLSGAAAEQLVHAHTRLMEIAEVHHDRFREQLHRGIGLVLLVRQWDGEPPADDGELAEETLAKAARALREAERRAPADPRPGVYLAEVYERLGQPTAARAAARRASARLPDPTLSDEESTALERWLTE